MPTAGERQSASEVFAKAKAKIARCRLVLDGELLDQHAQLEQRFAASPESVELAEELVALEARLADAEVEFVLRGMGRGPWRKLMADHPPSDEDKAAGAEFNPETFPPAAIAACLIDPVMTVEQVVELTDGFDEMQFASLWAACMKANLGGAVTHPESSAARALLVNGRPKSAQRSDLELAEVS